MQSLFLLANLCAILVISTQINLTTAGVSPVNPTTDSTTGESTSSRPAPVYDHQAAPSGLKPHTVWPDATSFYSYPYPPGRAANVRNVGPRGPYPPGYVYPGANSQLAVQSGQPGSGSYVSALVPAALSAFSVALRIFAKVILYVLSSGGFLFVGTMFTTLLCYLTPLCTIKFVGLGEVGKLNFVPWITPDRAAATARFISESIAKYDQMQKHAGN